MKGFIYRLGISIKEAGEQTGSRLLIIIGLKIKELV